MVSPMALEMAKMIETIIPDEAAGTITLNAVCNLVAPIPKEASRNELGTACSASSLMDEMYGMIIIPITIPADNELNPDRLGYNSCKKGVTTTKAKKPYTTVGTAANNSNKGFTDFLNDFGAYSLK